MSAVAYHVSNRGLGLGLRLGLGYRLRRRPSKMTDRSVDLLALYI